MDVEQTLNDQYDLEAEYHFCEAMIQKLEEGTVNCGDVQDDLKKCLNRLETLMREVQARELFSSNEAIDEIPTKYLKYLMLDAFCATLIQSMRQCASFSRVDALNGAKKFYRNFLETLHAHEIIEFNLPWKDENGDVVDVQRSRTLNDLEHWKNKKLMFGKQKQLEEDLKQLQKKHEFKVDETLLYQFTLSRLKLLVIKAVTELEMIEQELPLAERLLKIQSGEIKPDPPKMPPPSNPPFVIARDKEQKRVVGLGYPSVPTVTVNEWYDEMIRNGGFGPHTSKSANVVDDSKDEDSDDEIAQEKKRTDAQRWDEYKDSHRRGWGNTYNRG